MAHSTPQSYSAASAATGNQKLEAAAPARRPRRPRLQNRVTIEGLMFISLAVLIGLAAINTGTNLLYLVLGVMLAMLLVSGLIARNNLRRLTPSRHYPTTLHAGQPAHGVQQLSNAKRLAHSYALGLEDELVGPLQSWTPPRRIGVPGFIAEVAARQRGWCQVTLDLPERGLYKLRRTRIFSRFPFGFFEHVRAFEEQATLLVYPRLMPYGAFMRLAPRALGDIENDRRGEGMSIYGVRNYESGDPVRFIHWKQSAKGQGLKIKQFEEEVHRGFRLMLDLRCPPEPSEAVLLEFEKAVSLTASLARHLLRENTAVGLWTTSGNIPEGSGPHHLHRIMRALARVQPQPTDAAAVAPVRQEGQVTQLWIEYWSRPNLPATATRGGFGTHVLDVRQIKE